MKVVALGPKLKKSWEDVSHERMITDLNIVLIFRGCARLEFWDSAYKSRDSTLKFERGKVYIPEQW